MASPDNEDMPAGIDDSPSQTIDPAASHHGENTASNVEIKATDDKAESEADERTTAPEPPKESTIQDDNTSEAERIDAAAKESETVESQLIKAIEENNPYEVQGILSHHDLTEMTFDYKLPDPLNYVEGIRPVMLAAALGYEEIVIELLRGNTEVDAQSMNGLTALHFAAIHGHAGIAQLLLQVDARVDVTDEDGNTPLMTAIYFDQWEVVELPLLTYLRPDQEVNANHKNNYGQTALHLASGAGFSKLVEILADAGSYIDATDENGDTPLHLAASNGRRETLKTLLVYYRDPLKDLDINTQNNDGRTAFLQACTKLDVEAIALLLKNGADVTAKDKRGQTCAHFAANSRHESVIKELLKSANGLDWNARRDDGDTALHIAAYRGREETVATLIADRRINIAVLNNEKRTALSIAAAEGYGTIVFRLLQENEYFPELPAEGKGVFASSQERDGIDNFLTESLTDQSTSSLTLPMNAIMYWAVLNGRRDLMQQCIEKKPELMSWTRKGATWLHIAAIGGNIDIIDDLGYFDVVAKASGGITPLHLAARSGTYEILKELFMWLFGEKGHSKSEMPLSELVAKVLQQCSDTKITKAVHAIRVIIMKTDGGKSILHMAKQNRPGENRKIERNLWDVLDLCVRQIPRFVDEYQEGTQLLELAAEFEQRDQGLFLHGLISRDKLPPCYASPEWTSLHWAVYHGLPIVVWWLLANGGHLTNEEKARGVWIANKEKGKAQTTYAYILRLLHNQPVLENQNVGDEDESPEMQKSCSDVDPALQGTMFDFYQKGQNVDFHCNQSRVVDIIYRDGPRSIMNSMAGCDIRRLDVLRQELNQTKRKASYKKPGVSMGDFQFRWLHLPINDMDYVEELMTRVSIEAGITKQEHRSWIEFVRKSWSEMHAGGKKRYMKPQCARQNQNNGPTTTNRQEMTGLWSNTGKASDGKMAVNGERTPDRNRVAGLHGLALYMPYISWAKIGDVESESILYYDPPTIEHSMKELHAGSHGSTRHAQMTLDQYYYSSLENTAYRDNDQVISRYIKRKEQTSHYFRTGDLRPESDSSKFFREDESLRADPNTPILMVNQLWLWIPNEKTVITSTERGEKLDDQVVQGILNHLISSRDEGQSRPTSVQQMMELLMGITTGLFTNDNIPVHEDKMKSALDIFSDSIRHVATREMMQFHNFEVSLGKNLDDDIRKELGLRSEVKDIQDELNILHHLVEDQIRVWEQAFPSQLGVQRLQAFKYPKPTELKLIIEEKEKELLGVQDAVHTLLDLKQKQANIAEAKYTRKQAEASSKQSDTLMIFTIVTIVFTPMSFLTSLFALNVTDFPHESGTVTYRGSWIFPIIFCVSLGVSVIFISFAFKATWILDIPKAFKAVWLKIRKGQDSGSPPAATKLPENQVLRFGKIRRLRLQRGPISGDVESAATKSSESRRWGE